MKYYSRTILRNLTYKQALNAMEKGCSVSRKNWDGIHLIYNKRYIILLKSGEIMENPKEIYDTDKNDWCIVYPTEEAKRVLEKHFRLRDY